MTRSELMDQISQLKQQISLLEHRVESGRSLPSEITVSFRSDRPCCGKSTIIEELVQIIQKLQSFDCEVITFDHLGHRCNRETYHKATALTRLFIQEYEGSSGPQ